ncbi:hypothetical protein [Streptomyces spongiae]|uniref:Uncharacterized protein n=1 Tax=Streptomyces spongiae TaxID=565072 RepID=A0A5N8XA58_9ACTN|nr:hypothetical protein [Streptomyces spongiae]MPY56349.1 hypothetical protein [Streptomyces spongiae]
MFVGIDVEAGIAVTGGRDGVRPPEPLPGGAARYLRQCREQVEGLVLALPDQCFDEPGAVRREALYGEFADRLGLPLRQFVPRSVAAVASLRRSDGEVLVCRADADAAEAVLCRASGETVESLGAQRRAVTGRPRAEALGEPTGRAALLLARARTQPRYRAAPLRTPGNPTAGAVLDAFEPVEEALRSAVTDARARHEDTPVLMDGALGGHPLARGAVQEVTGGRQPGLLETHAAALGALLVATDSVRVRTAARHSVSLTVHGVRRGLLVESDIPLTVLGEPVPMAVLERGRAVTVDVPEAQGPDVRVRRDGRETDVPCPGLRGGRHRLGMHTSGDGPGVLVFRPDDGGEPVLLPLGAPTAGTTGATR